MPKLEIPPRPTEFDEEVLKKQAPDALPLVAKALGASWEGDKRVKAIAVLEEVILASTDGYERAKRLEDHHGWQGVNAAVVAALAPSLIDLGKYLSEATQEWVMRYGVRFPAKENDEVNYRNKSNNLIKARVVGVISSEAKALVQLIGVFQGGHPIREAIFAEQVTSVKRGTKNVGHNAFLMGTRVEEGVIKLPLKPPRPAADRETLITEATVKEQPTIEKTV